MGIVVSAPQKFNIVPEKLCIILKGKGSSLTLNHIVDPVVWGL